MKIKRLMTDNVSAVGPQTSVKDVAKIMRDLNVGAVPVCEGEKPLGIVTDRDIAIRSIADKEDFNHSVADIMSKDLVYATSDMSDKQAIELMSEHQIRRLPVIEDGELVGFLSFGDLAVESDDVEISKAIAEISYPSQPKSEKV